MRQGLNKLDRLDDVDVIRASPVYRNPPMGPQDQPAYLNAVVELTVRTSPHKLLVHFLNVEKALGRVRDVRWGPRTLDLDILTFGIERVDEPGLKIPHTHMLERSFVLIPLADLYPKATHPEDGRTYAELADEIGRDSLERCETTLRTDA